MDVLYEVVVREAYGVAVVARARGVGDCRSRALSGFRDRVSKPDQALPVLELNAAVERLAGRNDPYRVARLRSRFYFLERRKLPVLAPVSTGCGITLYMPGGGGAADTGGDESKGYDADNMTSAQDAHDSSLLPRYRSHFSVLCARFVFRF